MATEKKNYKLQGHEKFPLREGWLNKGLIAVSENNKVFVDKDIPAPDVFGIGNNMVKSLRYWLRAFGLVSDKGTAGTKLTDFGQLILKEDKYLEDYFTLWCLHSKIAKNDTFATTWYLFFNKCDAQDITKEQIYQMLHRELVKRVGGDDFSEKSLDSDLDVLLNMYGKDKGDINPEDKNVSPFSALGLIKKSGNNYNKLHPDRRIISEWEILYELSVIMKGLDQISIEEALDRDKGILKIYQISDIQANEFLDRLDAMGYIHVDRTAGLDIIYRVKDFTEEIVMKEYYRLHR